MSAADSSSAHAHLRDSVLETLEATGDLLSGLDEAGYRQSLPQAFDASIGAHVRHCLEHFEAVAQGAGCGEVDYDARARDRQVETDLAVARRRHRDLADWFRALAPETLAGRVLVRCRTSHGPADSPALESTLAREAMYAVIHAVHHQALIGVMLGLLGRPVPASFGVAPSTAAHLAETAR